MTWVIPGVYLLFLFVLLYRYAHRQPHLRSYPPLVNGPFISVLIPARNEAANIETCLRSILGTAYESIEVIVVDDRSSDGTAEIIDEVARSPDAHGRLRLVRGAELPAGWFGKPWALVQAYRVARGTMLLFADADTRHAAELIPRCVAAMEREHVALVSVLPRQEMVSFWERLVQPHIFLVHGPDYMTTRMYRTLMEIVEGWSKNLAIGVPLTLPPIPWLRRAAPYLMWIPALAWVAPPLWWMMRGGDWAIATILISLAVWVVVYWAEKAPVRYALLYPFGAAMVAFIMLRSAWRGGRKIVWRGRQYGTG